MALCYSFLGFVHLLLSIGVTYCKVSFIVSKICQFKILALDFLLNSEVEKNLNLQRVKRISEPMNAECLHLDLPVLNILSPLAMNAH
jgi:hypothetical protein